MIQKEIASYWLDMEIVRAKHKDRPFLKQRYLGDFLFLTSNCDCGTYRLSTPSELLDEALINHSENEFKKENFYWCDKYVLTQDLFAKQIIDASVSERMEQTVKWLYDSAHIVHSYLNKWVCLIAFQAIVRYDKSIFKNLDIKKDLQKIYCSFCRESPPPLPKYPNQHLYPLGPIYMRQPFSAGTKLSSQDIAHIFYEEMEYVKSHCQMVRVFTNSNDNFMDAKSCCRQQNRPP